MTIDQIIAAADTNRPTWVGELTNGMTEAILTFNKRSTARSVELTLREAGAAIVTAKRTEYGEYLLQAQWPTNR